MMLYLSLGAMVVLLVIVGLVAVLFRPDGMGPMYHIVFLQGDTAAVEQQIKFCLRKQKNRELSGKLLFIDRDLVPESIMTAELLLARETEAILCGPEQATEYIIWEIEHFGAGTD